MLLPFWCPKVRKTYRWARQCSSSLTGAYVSKGSKRALECCNDRACVCREEVQSRGRLAVCHPLHVHAPSHRTAPYSAGDVPAFKNFKASDGGSPAPAAPDAPAAAAAPAAPPPGKSYPPHQALQMPALSPTMTAGNIASIKVKPGV
jgi:hypothetical protein